MDDSSSSVNDELEPSTAAANSDVGLVMLATAAQFQHQPSFFAGNGVLSPSVLRLVLPRLSQGTRSAHVIIDPVFVGPVRHACPINPPSGKIPLLKISIFPVQTPYVHSMSLWKLAVLRWRRLQRHGTWCKMGSPTK
jgi:hypothetical protein